MYFKDDIQINLDTPLTFDGITYPIGYFRDEQRRESMGITYVPDPEPEPAPAPVPTACSPAQGLAALFILKGIKEADILDAIDNIPDEQTKYLASIAFSRATEWRWDSGNFQLLAGALGLSGQDIGELFEYAVTVEV